VSNGLPAERVFHIYNFIAPPAPLADGAVDAFRSRLGLGVDDWALLTPGRFVPVKGHKYLIDALAHLPAEIDGRRLRFLMLGDGPLGDALRARATGLGVEDRLVWCGWQQDPAAYFQVADAVIFPSRDRETFGNVILEAWSYGKPLVATAFRGAREIARHGEDSWVVPCDDPDALARGIQQVLSDPGLQQAMVSAGSRRLQQEFSETVIIHQYRDLYRRLTG
jgi:glycosyltransferase involved in cell wall biosynthesis